jgi:hypothetical protein
VRSKVIEPMLIRYFNDYKGRAVKTPRPVQSWILDALDAFERSGWSITLTMLLAVAALAIGLFEAYKQ